MERGTWTVDDMGAVQQTRSAEDYLSERAKRIELEERERLIPRPRIVRGR